MASRKKATKRTKAPSRPAKTPPPTKASRKATKAPSRPAKTPPPTKASRKATKAPSRPAKTPPPTKAAPTPRQLGRDWIDKTIEAFPMPAEAFYIDSTGNADITFYIPAEDIGELQDYLDGVPGGVVRLGLMADPTDEEIDGTDEQIEDGMVRRWTRTVPINIGSILIGGLYNPGGMYERMANYYSRISDLVSVHIRKEDTGDDSGQD